MVDVPRPMKATSGPLPTAGDWLYEIKWDGMRLVVTVDAGQVRLTSANGNDATVSYPELAGLGAGLGVSDAVLDGEVVVFDEAGRPDFGLLQRRMHVSNARQAAERANRYPGALCLFDLLRLDGHDVTGLPLSERRRLLEALVEPGPHWLISPVHTDGQALLDVATDRGLEGLVAKRPESLYRAGSRTSDWVKVKVRRRQEFVVGGWAPGTGGRAQRIGGLLIGYHPIGADGQPAAALRYAGRVGSGLSDDELRFLATRFEQIATGVCPFDPSPPPALAGEARWVEPSTVVEVAYGEWTSDGILRHPTYAGRRTDVDAGSVTREP